MVWVHGRIIGADIWIRCWASLFLGQESPGTSKGPESRMLQIPGLVNIYIAIEHGPVEIVDFHMKHGDFP